MATQRDIAIKELKKAGYAFKEHCKKHDKYHNASLNTTIMLKRHKVTENTVRYIKKEIEQNEGDGNR